MERQIEEMRNNEATVETPETPSKKDKGTLQKILIIIGVIIVILLLLHQCGIFTPVLQDVGETDKIGVRDGNGDLVAKDEDIIQKMRDMMDASNVPVNVNATPYAEGIGKPLNWMIENPSGSNKNLLIEVYLVEDGNVGRMIYTSKDLLPPSSHLSCIDDETGEELPGYDYLIEDLPTGEYDAIATFKAYTTDDQPKYIGMANASIKVVIK